MAHELISEAHRHAVKQLEAAGGDVNNLREELKTVLIVHAAQGIIDNGAFQYFFENDWPGQPRYSVFSDAYRRIGATKNADWLDRAVELLALDNPEQDANRRQQRMEQLWEQGVTEFADLSGKACGDESVWDKLRQFIENNRQVVLAK